MPSVFSKLPVMISDEDIIDKRYQNGLVYILKHKTKNLKTYIGSTIDFRIRYNYHKSSYNRFPDTKLYKYISENDGWENWIMEKLFDYPCNNKRCLEFKENETINNYDSSLNSFRAYCSVKEQNTFQYIKNRERILEQTLEYRKKHREKNKEYSKQYNNTHKDLVSSKRKTRINCDNCGCSIRKVAIARHKKTPKCINHINTPF